MKLKYLLTSLLLVGSLAWARVDFEQHSFNVTEFRDFNKLETLCNAPAAASFWCSRLDHDLTLITTKASDYFFDETGELVAYFIKQQKGQNFFKNGEYTQALDNNQNLIPVAATVPGGAVLLDGEYSLPENVEVNWEETNDGGDAPSFEGTFSHQIGDVQIEKTVLVRSVAYSTVVDVVASRVSSPAPTEGSETDGETDAEETEAEETEAEETAVASSSEPVTVQYALPGVAKTDSPTVKIGQGDSFSLNPVSQAVPDPGYISIQNNNRNTANALILRPRSNEGELEAIYLQPNIIAMQSTLAAEPGAEVTLNLQEYIGQNELVRYSQEGYLDLPGLFKPNILGRLSLGMLWVLQRIYDVVGNWGLAIIVLTLIFRALIWPLISTQTKSMYGMQELQPKLQALQKKHKDDREKLTQETMKLYKEAGVNPAGGCLPIILQMPLFIILWRIFANFEFNAGFLWLPDLGQADPYYILPFLYVAVIFAQSYFMSRGNPQSLKQQLLMNVVFVFLFLSFPAGVILYYVVSMIVQVFQYWLIQRERPKTPAKAT